MQPDEVKQFVTTHAEAAVKAGWRMQPHKWGIYYSLDRVAGQLIRTSDHCGCLMAATLEQCLPVTITEGPIYDQAVTWADKQYPEKKWPRVSIPSMEMAVWLLGDEVESIIGGFDREPGLGMSWAYLFGHEMRDRYYPEIWSDGEGEGEEE